MKLRDETENCNGLDMEINISDFIWNISRSMQISHNDAPFRREHTRNIGNFIGKVSRDSFTTTNQREMIDHHGEDYYKEDEMKYSQKWQMAERGETIAYTVPTGNCHIEISDNHIEIGLYKDAYTKGSTPYYTFTYKGGKIYSNITDTADVIENHKDFGYDISYILEKLEPSIGIENIYASSNPETQALLMSYRELTLIQEIEYEKRQIEETHTITLEEKDKYSRANENEGAEYTMEDILDEERIPYDDLQYMHIEMTAEEVNEWKVLLGKDLAKKLGNSSSSCQDDFRNFIHQRPRFLPILTKSITAREDKTRNGYKQKKIQAKDLITSRKEKIGTLNKELESIRNKLGNLQKNSPLGSVELDTLNKVHSVMDGNNSRKDAVLNNLENLGSFRNDQDKKAA